MGKFFLLAQGVGGLTSLFQADGRTLNPQLLKLNKRSENHWTILY